MDSTTQKIILEARGGAGGDEAALFAGDLVTMYKRYAERKGWSFFAMDSSPGNLGGYKTFVGQISGAGVYDALKYESGTHRIQRVPKTEKSGRVHPSTATIAILPVVEEKEVVIKDYDLEVSFSR